MRAAMNLSSQSKAVVDPGQPLPPAVREVGQYERQRQKDQWGYYGVASLYFHDRTADVLVTDDIVGVLLWFGR